MQVGQTAINYRKKKSLLWKKCLRDINMIIPKLRMQAFKKCGYKSKHTEQFNVFHIDGDLNNCSPMNLKTICANCQRIMQKQGVRWKQGDLIPDF